jgi:hypothetical protein
MRDYDPTDLFGTMPEIPNQEDGGDDFEFKAIEGAIRLLCIYIIAFIIIFIIWWLF